MHGTIINMSNTSGPRESHARTSGVRRNAFAQDYPLVTRWALILMWLLGLLATFAAVNASIFGDVLGHDAHAYWLAAQGELRYDEAPGERDAYLYSPAFVAMIRPLAVLPWHLFLVTWICLESVALLWLVKPLTARWAIPTIMLCMPELVVGNVYMLLAAVAVLGFRRPLLWSFAMLTKVTTGVGLLWFVVRGDWRRLAEGAGGTAVIVAVFYVMAPAQWQAWVEFLLEHSDGAPGSSVVFVGRCAFAVALVAVGARRGWPWLIPPAMVLASPVLVGSIPLTMLVAIPRLMVMTDDELLRPRGRVVRAES